MYRVVYREQDIVLIRIVELLLVWILFKSFRTQRRRKTCQPTTLAPTSS